VAFIKRYRYSYQEAENGLEAFEAYKNSPNKFQTILMDMSMPVSKFTQCLLRQDASLINKIVDGMTSTREIRQYELENKLTRCRIVALTGLASASARLEALSSGVDQFMTKPMNFRALETVLKRGYERRRKASESGIPRVHREEEKGTENEEMSLSSHPEAVMKQEGQVTEHRHGGAEEIAAEGRGPGQSAHDIGGPQQEGKAAGNYKGIEEMTTEDKKAGPSSHDKANSQHGGEGTEQPWCTEEQPKEDRAGKQLSHGKASALEEEAVSIEQVEDAKDSEPSQEVQKAGT
jgi:CheY-like chemotaxis protein